MDWRGHLGFNLLVMSSLFYLMNLSGVEINRILIISSVLSSLPDIDLRLELPHRKVTHNVFFGLIISLVAGYLASYLGFSFRVVTFSFLIAFTTHLLCDLLTKMPFRPLYPFVKTPVALRLFRSSSNVVNTLFLVLGVVAYYVYVSKYGFFI